MKGSVEIQMDPDEIMELHEGQSIQIPSGTYHRVSPLKHSPACYMYVYFINRTDLMPFHNGSDSFLQATCPAAVDLDHQTESLTNKNYCRGFCWERLKQDFKKKFDMWTRSMMLIGQAAYSILSRQPMLVEKIDVPDNDI
ncbi:vitamin K-dependent gamma-carboxylase [Trichonephila inaurata madagascariensis]|uniref:Vitamin K-dependent gamma-carboxylase n=1 Tax=Trichonephila inaurata madagascariensis TaxID=2747483 RepID=A0A8X6WU26_9ARAC|nr:vitamin K-dependent gamma-carboxylase [Trichonephila inaurata madagascariensis]